MKIKINESLKTRDLDEIEGLNQRDPSSVDNAGFKKSHPRTRFFTL